MSAEYSSGDTSPLKGPAPKAQPEDTSDVDKPEDSMPLTSSSPAERPVQFTSNVPSNGDAKVEIGDTGTAPVFVGLGKEELMKYANDPFWVKLRWFLFILFWVLWVAMLAGAIVIIVLAPKCAEKKVEPESYYELNVKTFAKDGNLAELGARAKYLSELGVSTVIISDVLKKDDGGTVDFKNVDESYGTTADFAEAVKKLKTEGLHVLMNIGLNHFGLNHSWFTDKPEFYIRKPEEEVAQSVWKTADGSSAWASNPNDNSTKYLQQFPRNVDLDYRNKDVVSEMKSVLDLWKAKGVSGFVISDASYLVENLDHLNNASATINQPENLEILKKLLNKRQGDIANLVKVKALSVDDTEKYEENGILVLPEHSITDSIDQYTKADEILKVFEKIHNQPGVIRLTGLQTQDLQTRNILRLLAYTSNSSVISTFGDEIDEFSPNSVVDFESASKGESYKFLADLMKIQKSFDDDKNAKYPFRYPAEPNKNVVAIVRTDRYIILANTDSEIAHIEFKKYFGDREFHVSVVISTPNAASKFKPGVFEEDHIMLPSRSAIVLKRRDDEE